MTTPPGNRPWIAGEIGQRLGNADWSATPLGPMETWPDSLINAAGLIVRSSFPMFLVWGPARTLVYNQAYKPILGGHHPRAMGRSFWDVWSEVRSSIEPVIDGAFAGEESFFEDFEVTLWRAGEPEQAWFTFSYSPIYDVDGGIPGVLCVCVETTAAIRARQEIESASRRQRQMFEQAPGFICILEGPEHRFTFTNAAHRRLFGRDLTGLTVREAFGEGGGQGFYEMQDQVLSTGRRIEAKAAPAMIERPGEAPHEHFLDFVYEPMRDGEGRVFGIFCEGFDVTEATRQRSAQEASESRLRFLDRLTAATWEASSADEILAVTTRMMVEHLQLSDCAYADMDEDEDGFTIRGDHAAPGARSIVGHYSLADFGRLAVEKLGAGEPLVINDNLKEIAPEEAATFQAIGISATICMPLVKDGKLTALMAIHDNKPRRWTEDDLALTREVTARSWANIERVRAQAELRESEARFRLMADASPQIVWITDAEGRAEFFNRQWAKYVGADGLPPDAASVAAWHLHPEDQAATMEAFEAARRTGGIYEVEHRIRSRGGEYRWFLVRAFPFRDSSSGEIVRWYGASVDIHDRKLAEAALRELNDTLEQRVSDAIAERRETEEQLRQSQKLEAIGHLTGGVAHDFNNLLTIIRSSVDLLRRRDLPEERRRRYVDAIGETADRAATLTNQLLAFARRQPLQATIFNASEAVARTVDIVRPMVGGLIEIEIQGGREPAFVEADRNQFETALVNMAVNARDAMPEGGRIAVRVGGADVIPAVRGHAKSFGDFVTVSIADTGVGIPADVRDRIFEPFFTTKGVGKGTGLGLSQVYGFAKQSGGEILVEGGAARGTIFTMYLPRAAAGPDAQPRNLGEAVAAPSTGRILLVEDNQQVGDFAAQLLNDLGHTTTWVHDAASALKSLKLHPDAYDLVFSDVVMPGAMDGVGLAREIRRLYPRLPVVLTSGYSHVLAEGGAGGFELLRKPYSVEALSTLMRKMLKGRRTA